MPKGSKKYDLWEAEYRKLLNKKDPLDQAIIELAEKQELTIDLVDVKDEARNRSRSYSKNRLAHRGKYSS
jgi:hypothetical protein